MILRRVIEHVRTQNWTAVALDFVIVVVGVFMGIQLGNWNDARGDRAEEIRYLRALAADMDASRQFAEEQMAFIDKQASAQKRLAAISVGDGLPISRADLDALVHRGVFELYVAPRRLATFNELKNTGKLALIGDPGLRAGLQDLEAALERLDEYERDAMQQYISFSDPFLINHYDMRGVVSQPPSQTGNDAINWLSPPENVETVIAALKTDFFRNIVLFRASVDSGVRTHLESVRSKYDKVSTLIDARLDKLEANE